ncbi:MAG: DNA replication/repair protein RecF [Oscillatoria sp. PMC 1068.18]|nr:DNA replication/repair protein RecF [Oscillatoria sp. PMC 1076.18]MEC4990517.1 DNA replication/repair protein RecF [Oscillatoria sp. PMC 1068.18]
MFLKSLHLRNFRNYRDSEINFEAPKTILVGDNAQGKSNLLEAVELLATLKSHRTSRDRDLIMSGTNAGQISATLEKAYSTVDLAITLRDRGRRTLNLNRENLRRQLEFLGVVNAVQFSSLDLDLVRGAPERRRNWVDSLLVQIEPIYAYILQQYERVLRQRNALLKEMRNLEANQSEAKDYQAQLALWDAQLAANGSRVTRRRARVIKRLAPIAQIWHAKISSKTEVLEIKYNPNINWTEDDPERVQQAFLDKIQQRRLPEQQQGKTLVGPHRDEIEFTINETPARSYGSQGQQRTLVLALKLAELKLIAEVVGEPPLLLLDDVLAELDPNRQNHLLEAIGSRFQTLITTTHLGSFDPEWIKASQIFTVQAGQISRSYEV